MSFRFPLFRLLRRKDLDARIGAKRFTSVEAFFDDLFPLWFNLDFSPNSPTCETYMVNEE